MVGLNLHSNEDEDDYLGANVWMEHVGIGVVEDSRGRFILLSHPDARKLAEFILENIEEER